MSRRGYNEMESESEWEVRTKIFACIKMNKLNKQLCSVSKSLGQNQSYLHSFA